jgi:uncharacterized protein YprB with RNaseH-like and TPR domain
VPNSAHIWTRDEELDAVAADSYETFRQKHPDVTRDAWRQRRGDLLAGRREFIAVTEAPIVPNIPAVDFNRHIGLDIVYFDIETTFSTQPRVLYAALADGFGNIEGFDLINYPGKSWLDDSRLVDAYAQRLSEADVAVSWNGKLFDVPVLNGRLMKHRLRPVNISKHIDLMYYASGSSARIGRRSLESVSKYFHSANSKTPLSPEIWDEADHGDMEKYQLIVEHCDADVLVLRDVFAYLKPLIRNIHR